MNYKCITNELSRGLRITRPAQSITALTRRWAARGRFALHTVARLLGGFVQVMRLKNTFVLCSYFAIQASTYG